MYEIKLIVVCVIAIEISGFILFNKKKRAREKLFIFF